VVGEADGSCHWCFAWLVNKMNVVYFILHQFSAMDDWQIIFFASVAVAHNTSVWAKLTQL
jgi:hypothetical protein